MHAESINFCGVNFRRILLAGVRAARQHRIPGDAPFDAGWGGAVWKTIGEPISIRHRATAPIDYKERAHDRLNNIELISDRRWKITFARSRG